MEALFDTIPVPYRAERLGRMRDFILQIEADYEQYKALKWKLDIGIAAESEREDLDRTMVWLKRNIIAYRRLNAVSIEGITSVRVGAYSASFFHKM